jgi:hypothetical protein
MLRFPFIRRNIWAMKEWNTKAVYPVHHIPSSPKHSKRSEPISPVLCLPNPWAKILLVSLLDQSRTWGSLLNCRRDFAWNEQISDSTPVACIVALHLGLYLVLNGLIGRFDTFLEAWSCFGLPFTISSSGHPGFKSFKTLLRAVFCYTHSADKVPK